MNYQTFRKVRLIYQVRVYDFEKQRWLVQKFKEKQENNYRIINDIPKQQIKDKFIKANIQEITIFEDPPKPTALNYRQFQSPAFPKWQICPKKGKQRNVLQYLIDQQINIQRLLQAIQYFFEMRTSAFRPPLQGHRVNPNQNEDLKNKMTYQQLLNANHDLSKQNQQLKNISNRLGNQLQKLHIQFDIKPREENVQLYNAINAHPILNKYHLTLIPLLQAYEAKIQEFQHSYENIHQEFISLQKKYEEVTLENQRLRTLLTDKIAQLIETYKNGTSDKLGTDFTQMIFHQVNEKQKILSEENSRLDKQNVKFRAESQKISKEVTQWKKKVDQFSIKAKSTQTKNQKLQKQNKQLKEDIMNLQTAKCQVDNQRKKIASDLERAQSQISFLNKHKDALVKNIDRLRISLQQTENLQQNRTEISFNSKQKSIVQDNSHTNDDHKKLFKLQKDYDTLLKQRNKLKDQIQQTRLPLEEANERIAELKKRNQNVEQEKNKIEVSEMKAKKMYQKTVEKSKDDLQRLKKQFQREIQSLKLTHSQQRDRRNKRIAELQKDLQKVNIQKSYLENEKALNVGIDKQDKKSIKGKDTNYRQIQKLQDKISLNQQLFKEQIQIIENDYQYVKRQCQKLRAQNKEKSEELRRTKQELQKTNKELVDITQQKTLIVEQIKRIRTQYQGNLKDKQRLFDQKIKEIKMFVQQSERRRKADKEKVAQASRQFKRVLEEIRNTYEERIKMLENQQSNSKVRKNDY